MEYYNPQRGKVYTIDDDFAAQFTQRGFAPEHTGGGCMAWHKVSDARACYISITYYDCELGGPETAQEPAWMVGVYSDHPEDDALDGVDDLTLADALHSADVFTARYLTA